MYICLPHVTITVIGANESQYAALVESMSMPSLPASRICFSTSEGILLLREVTLQEQLFARPSPDWEKVAVNLSNNCDHLYGITLVAANEKHWHS